MSDILFSELPQHNRAQPTPCRVATLETSNAPQGGGSGPVPISKPQGDWLCDEPHQYPLEPRKYSFKPPKTPLETFNKVVEDRDQTLCKQLKGEINFLMVVSGLLLAIVTAFTIQSYPLLQEDKRDTISDLLLDVVRLLNNTNVQENFQPFKSFAPDPRIIVINQLWFSSITLSLFTVIMGTFCLQWISAFSRGSDLNNKSIPPEQSLALRQLRYEGIVFWGVRHAPEILLFTVQVSIGLFASGLIYFLWNISHRAALPALVLASIAGALLSIANLMPFLQPLLGLSFRKFLTTPQCPYKSPTSWLVQSICTFFAFLVQPFQNTEIFADWLLELPLPFTDYLWKKYDSMCASLQESLPGGHSRLRYFGLGLLSALDNLAYDTNTIVTIGHCCEALQPIFSKAKDWEMFSQETLSCDEKGFLDEKYNLELRFLPQRLNTTALRFEHASKVRADFINALTLQYLAGHNEKLARILFRHRVELYIRIKNSTRFIVRGENSGFDFGKSLHCPLQHHGDIGELDSELKFQFLSCIKRLIHLGRATDDDFLSAAAIVQIENPAIAIVPEITLPLSPAQQINPTTHETLDSDHQSLATIERSIPGNHPEPGMESSPPHDVDTGEPSGDTNEKDQFKASLETLCSEVLQQLVLLHQSDFNDITSFVELRKFLGLPVEAIPRSEYRSPR